MLLGVLLGVALGVALGVVLGVLLGELLGVLLGALLGVLCKHCLYAGPEFHQVKTWSALSMPNLTSL